MRNQTEIIRRAELELHSAGLRPSAILADGQKHRCPVEGKPRQQDGEYCLYADDNPTIVWANYRTGDHGNKALFKNDSIVMTSVDSAQHLLSQASAAVASHPYLTRKGIVAPPGLRLKDGRLIVPAYDGSGNLSTVQMIDDSGEKRFLKGGQVRGSSFTLTSSKSNDEAPIYLAEGLATAVSIWLALEKSAEVRVCFSAGNLLPVALSVQQKYQMRDLIICADNDRFTPGNPGLTKALEAARAVDAKVTLPNFPEGVSGTDFNDLHLASGLDEVRRQLGVFLENPDPPEPGLRVLTLGQFIDWPIPPREHLLYPILSEQGLALIYAMRGLGKTYVALCVGLAVASGKGLFSWVAKGPRQVLYIDGEMPARAMQERLQRLVETLNISPEHLSNFMLITPDIQKSPIPNLATPAGQSAIEPYLKDVSLVIVDNIATLCRAGRENDTESWLPVQGWLLDLRRRGLSVLVVHHAGKNGDQRGTSAKEDIMDTVITLRRPRDYQAEEGARFEVHLTKARGLAGGEAKSFEAQLHDSDGCLKWQVKNLEDRDEAEIRDLLEQGKSVREIAATVDRSKSSVHRVCQKIKLAA